MPVDLDFTAAAPLLALAGGGLAVLLADLFLPVPKARPGSSG